MWTHMSSVLAESVIVANLAPTVVAALSDVQLSAHRRLHVKTNDERITGQLVQRRSSFSGHTA